MAITVRLTFDVQAESVEDTDENARFVRDATKLTFLSDVLGKAAKAELVGASRLSTGLMRGNATVEAVEGRIWNRVDAMPEIS